jgi:hypothetical protein
MRFLFCVECTNIRIKNELFSDKCYIVGEREDGGMERLRDRRIERLRDRKIEGLKDGRMEGLKD